MKRIVTLLLAAGLVLGAAGAGQAADVKVKGMWDFNFEWSNTSFAKDNTSDRFKARQRLRTQVDFIASESLKGVIFFEIGDQNWGKADQGASLGTDGSVVEVRYSYIDWVVPNTDLKVRMGLQPITLPGFVADSAVLNHDAAGITLAYDFNDNVGANLFWMRLENDNGGRKNYRNFDGANRSDAFDLFGLTVPLTFDGVKVVPWGAYASVGRNALNSDNAAGHVSGGSDQLSLLRASMTPAGTGTFASSDDASGDAWWLGLTGEITAWNPFRLAWDVNYGSVDMGRGFGTMMNGAAYEMDLKRRGWMAALMAEYKLDMMTPGLIFWYASGDDDNPFDGSERMPSMRPAWKPTQYGFDNDYAIGSSCMLGADNSGMWGVVAQLKDITFVEDLSHTLKVAYYRGTNDEEMAERGFARPYGTVNDADSINGLNGYTYLTKKDDAWEVNFDTNYKIYEDLTLNVELGYIHLGLDSDVWGNVITDNTRENNFKAAVNMRYAF